MTALKYSVSHAKTLADRLDNHAETIEKIGKRHAAYAYPLAVTDLRGVARLLREISDAFGHMAEALESIESEMRAGLGSSYGETREQVRRAARIARKLREGNDA